MIILGILIAHWYLSLFFQTFFLHRYASHKLYTMSLTWEKIFYIFTFITQGSSFLNPAAYAIMHRKHHVYADTLQDPHSPKYIKVPWFTCIDVLVLESKPQEPEFLRCTIQIHCQSWFMFYNLFE